MPRRKASLWLTAFLRTWFGHISSHEDKCALVHLCLCASMLTARGPEPKEQVSCCLLPTVAEPSSATSQGSFSPGQLWSKGRHG